MISDAEIVKLAASVMEQRGYAVVRHGTWLEHRDSGLAIHPVLLQTRPSGSSILTTCGVTTSHPRLAPDGVCEYQHATGATASEAVRNGFDQWLQIDFVVLLDALRERLEDCMALEFKFPRDGGAEFIRRAVLGPVGHAVAHPPAAAACDVEHPFCPCCLLTNSYQAFRPFIEADGLFGIRLYAARDQDGVAQADCRINGNEYEPGKQALRDYVAKWAQAGFEVRKQYVLLQTVTSSAADGWRNEAQQTSSPQHEQRGWLGRLFGRKGSPAPRS
jgi:hypothetical protein